MSYREQGVMRMMTIFLFGVTLSRCNFPRSVLLIAFDFKVCLAITKTDPFVFQ